MPGFRIILVFVENIDQNAWFWEKTCHIFQISTLFIVDSVDLYIIILFKHIWLKRIFIFTGFHGFWGFFTAGIVCCSWAYFQSQCLIKLNVHAVKIPQNPWKPAKMKILFNQMCLKRIIIYISTESTMKRLLIWKIWQGFVQNHAFWSLFSTKTRIIKRPGIGSKNQP